MRVIIYNGFFISVTITALVADSCTKWKLSGGSVWYEGIVEVLFQDQTWVNICADDSFSETEVCQRIVGQKGETTVDEIHQMDNNVFSAEEQNTSISYTMCKHSKNRVNESEGKCRAAFLCCYEYTKVCSAEKEYLNKSGICDEPCSKNWTTTVNKDKYLRSKNHLRFDQLRDETSFINENIGKSWTRSALQHAQEQSCKRKLSSEGGERGFNCTSRCEVTPELVFVFLYADNKACCLEMQTRQTLPRGDCSITDLRVVHETESAPILCLAAEVVNGVRYISIENCSRYFPTFRVSNRNIVSPPPPTTKMTTTAITTSATAITTSATAITTATTKTNHSNSNGRTNESASTEKNREQAKVSDERIDTVIIAVVICVSLLIMVCVVFSIVISWKFKQSGRNREQQRPNSVINRAYSIEPFHYLPQDDEEYTLISDMDVGHGSAGAYVPPVPERGDKLDSYNTKSQEKSTKEIEIITLAEYSIPSDNVRVGYKISQTSDYCMTTYDDPIRHKLQEGQEKKNERESIENGSQSNNRDSETISKDLDRNSRNSQMSGLNRNSAVIDSTTVFTGMKYADERSDTIESGNTLHTYEESVKTFEQKLGTAVPDNPDEPVTLYKDANAKDETDVGDDSDYEDASFIDGNLPTKCASKGIFEEHVCLGCLKPEHLTKLGIKIISDEMYEKSKDLQRSVSEPSSHVYYNKVESDSGELGKSTSERTPQEDQNNKRYQVENKEDTLTELNVVRRQKKFSNVKRCSVCHTVYDRLGDTQQNVWANCTDNVYDQFGNFKHFKHRGQISGKRMNST